VGPSVYPVSLLDNDSVQSFPRQQIHDTVEEEIGATLSLRFVSCQRRVCGSVCVSRIVAR
jgi:hypothetical protein